MNIEQIWRVYRGNLKAFIMSKVANPEDAEDLLQEVLIKTHQGLKNLNSQHSVKAWLLQIANRSIIDYYRRRATHQQLLAEDLWYQDSQPDIQGQLAQCIAPFIEALPESQSQLLKRFDLDGESQKSYAQQHGIAYSTLKSQVQKSRLALKELFEDCCHYSLDSQGNIAGFEQKPDSCHKC